MRKRKLNVLFPFLQGYSLSILGVVTLDVEYFHGAKASIAVNRDTPSPSWLGVTVSRYISFCDCYYHTTAINCLYFYTRLPSTATIFDFLSDCRQFFSFNVSIQYFSLYFECLVSVTVSVNVLTLLRCFLQRNNVVFFLVSLPYKMAY